MTEDQIQEYMRRFEIDRERAVFILAIEEGEVDSDVEELDAQGNLVRQERPLME